MRPLSPLLIVLALAACGTPAQSPSQSGSEPVAVAEQDGDDCAVIAAVAREHYRFNQTDNVAPPLWLDGEETGWAPRCDWARHGVSFPRVFDPDAPQAEGETVQWVSFKRPRYDGQGAVIESGILHGPLHGYGVECRVRSGFAGWTVAGECLGIWIS